MQALIHFSLAPLECRRDMAMLGFIHRIALGKGPPPFQQFFVKDNSGCLIDPRDQHLPEHLWCRWPSLHSCLMHLNWIGRARLRYDHRYFVVSQFSHHRSGSVVADPPIDRCFAEFAMFDLVESRFDILDHDDKTLRSSPLCVCAKIVSLRMPPTSSVVHPLQNP